MNRQIVFGLVFLGSLAFALPATAQTTVKFKQGVNGYSGTLDTYIDKFMPNDFYGNIERIEVRDWSGGTAEKQNLLISFDVSSLPSNATVTSAKLTMYNIRQRGANSNAMVLEKVTGAWNNQSTWNMGVPTVTASGVTCTPGSGLAEDPALPPGASEVYVITGLAALVQGWKTTPGTNYGIMLSSTSNLNFRFASSEYPTASVRPELEVTYTTPAPVNPPTITVTSAPTASATSPITVTGTANATAPNTLTTITWSNASSGASGTASGTSAWTASIPLVRGNNVITVTATDSAGGTGTASFSVTFTPPAKTNKDDNEPCGLGVAGESGGSLAVCALAVALLLVAGFRRPAA